MSERTLFDNEPPKKTPQQVRRPDYVIARCANCWGTIEVTAKLAELLARAGGDLVKGRGDTRKPVIDLDITGNKHRCRRPRILVVDLVAMRSRAEKREARPAARAPEDRTGQGNRAP